MRSEASYPSRPFPHSESGFSLVELMVVVGIAAVCMAVTIAVSPSFIRTAKADSGTAQAMEALRYAREVAISQRRNVQIEFIGTNEIRISRLNIPTGSTQLRSVPLEGGLRFMLVSGVPDTPDLFGRTAAASFPSATRMFTSEGSFIDNQGNPMNGTLFMAVPDQPNSARAITFFGQTALLRMWKWNGATWVE